jgi:hypothetical protein
MTTTTTAKSWATAKSRVKVAAWAHVGLGSAALLALLTSPVVAVGAGTAAALIALTCRALVKASRTVDRILAEELDR